MARIRAASIAIHHDGRFLLVKRGRGAARGQYAFPGGRLEAGETAKQAAMRELFEETALTVSDLRLVERIELAGGDDVYDLDVFRSSSASGRLQAGDDAADAGWFTIAEMRRLDITASTLAIAEKIANEICEGRGDALNARGQAEPKEA